MQVVPLSEVLGVELVDFDINRPCSPEEQGELRRLLCDHSLLAIRGHDLTDAKALFVDGWFTDDGVLDWRETVVAFAGGTPYPPAV